MSPLTATVRLPSSPRVSPSAHYGDTLKQPEAPVGSPRPGSTSPVVSPNRPATYRRRTLLRASPAALAAANAEAIAAAHATAASAQVLANALAATSSPSAVMMMPHSPSTPRKQQPLHPSPPTSSRPSSLSHHHPSSSHASEVVNYNPFAATSHALQPPSASASASGSEQVNYNPFSPRAAPVPSSLISAGSAAAIQNSSHNSAMEDSEADITILQPSAAGSGAGGSSSPTHLMSPGVGGGLFAATRFVDSPPDSPTSPSSSASSSAFGESGGAGGVVPPLQLSGVMGEVALTTASLEEKDQIYTKWFQEIATKAIEIFRAKCMDIGGSLCVICFHVLCVMALTAPSPSLPAQVCCRRADVRVGLCSWCCSTAVRAHLCWWRVGWAHAPPSKSSNSLSNAMRSVTKIIPASLHSICVVCTRAIDPLLFLLFFGSHFV